MSVVENNHSPNKYSRAVSHVLHNVKQYIDANLPALCADVIDQHNNHDQVGTELQYVRDVLSRSGFIAAPARRLAEVLIAEAAMRKVVIESINHHKLPE